MRLLLLTCWVSVCVASVSVQYANYKQQNGVAYVTLSFSPNVYLKNSNMNAIKTLDPNFTIWFDSQYVGGYAPVFMRSATTRTTINPNYISKLSDTLQLRYDVSQIAGETVVLFADRDRFPTPSGFGGMVSLWSFPVDSSTIYQNCTSVSTSSIGSNTTYTLSESSNRLTVVYDINVKSSTTLLLSGTISSVTGNEYTFDISSPTFQLRANRSYCL